MKTLSNILKTAAVAGLMGLGAAATTAAPADAATFRRCNDTGCYRVHCDDRGYCYRMNRNYYNSGYDGYYDRGYYDNGYYRSVRVCDEWGCRTVRRHTPRAHIGIGLRF